MWIFLIQFTFCLADSQSPLFKLNDVETGMLLVADDRKGYYYEIPKLKTDVKIKIDGMIASATVDQMFTNDGDIPIEAIYVFPLPEEAAVYEMQMLVGNRLIESEVKEKAEAKKIYTKAKKEGKRASLAEQQRPNIFTNSVANIMPGDTLIVRLKYVDYVRYDNGIFSLRFPSVVGPRYIPGEIVTGYSGSGWSYDTDQVEDASRITPPILPPGAETVNSVSLTVELNAGLEIESVQSITHAVDLEKTGTGRRIISLSKGVDIPNRDFMLEYSIKEGKEDGKWTWWWMNGQKKYERTFKDGDGLYTAYYEDGQKMEEGYLHTEVETKMAEEFFAIGAENFLCIGEEGPIDFPDDSGFTSKYIEIETQEKIENYNSNPNDGWLVWCSVCEGNSHDDDDCPLQ
jgi:hypothetical protein